MCFQNIVTFVKYFRFLKNSPNFISLALQKISSCSRKKDVKKDSLICDKTMNFNIFFVPAKLIIHLRTKPKQIQFVLSVCMCFRFSQLKILRVISLQMYFFLVENRTLLWNIVGHRHMRCYKISHDIENYGTKYRGKLSLVTVYDGTKRKRGPSFCKIIIK